MIGATAQQLLGVEDVEDADQVRAEQPVFVHTLAPIPVQYRVFKQLNYGEYPYAPTVGNRREKGA